MKLRSLKSHKVKLLGTYIDKELKLNDNVDIKCKNAARKLNALMRLGNILPLNKRRVLMKVFIESACLRFTTKLIS